MKMTTPTRCPRPHCGGKLLWNGERWECYLCGRAVDAPQPKKVLA